MRLAASVVLTGLIVVGVSGCAFITPQETTKINQVSDGVNADIGGVGVRNAILFTVDGTTAALVASFVNTGNTEQTLQLQYTTSSGPMTQQVVVPADGLVSVRPGGKRSIQLDDISTRAGAMFPIAFSTGSTAKTVQVPVLNTSLPGYETLTPVPSPSPTKTKTHKGATPSPTSSLRATPQPGSTVVPSPYGTTSPAP